MKVTTKQTAGLWNGLIDGEVVCGPYMNKGMATRQANRIKSSREAAPVEPAYITAARAEGVRLGLTTEQIERFIARQS